MMPVAGAFLPDSPVKFALQAAGNVWLGFYMYFGVILLLLVGLAALIRLLNRNWLGLNWHGGILILSLVAALAVTGYGLVHAQNTVVERYEIQVDKPGEDMKVVLIGDLHLSVNSRLATTRRMVELINAQEPDAVVIAGDIFTSSYEGLAHPEQYAEALRGIRSKYGVYAVYGNHDVEETLFGGFAISPVSQAFRTAQMEDFFRDCGFTVLYDQVVDIGGVQLVGRVDGEKAGDGTKNRMTPAQLLSDIDQSLPVVVLEHEPKEFKALKEAGADVALCGHTHAGQMFPGNLVVPFFNENAWGHVRVHDLETVVTAGVGYYGPPMRVGTDSEVSVVNLKFKR
jgi:predicted MPP superfamily phosphohydrolase